MEIGDSVELVCTVNPPRNDVDIGFSWSRLDGVQLNGDHSSRIFRIEKFEASLAASYQCRAYTASFSATDYAVIDIKR